MGIGPLPGGFEFISPLSHQQYLDSLADLAFQDANWMYSTDLSDTQGWQADCVARGTLIFTELNGEASRRSDRPVALISHGCDLEANDEGFACLAPVVQMQAFAAGNDRVNAIRSNRLTSTFFLPACGFLPEAFLDFERMCSVSVPEVRRVWDANSDAATRLRLTREAWWFFLGKLTHFLAREEDYIDYPRRRGLKL